MMQQIGVGAADPRGDRLQRHRLRALGQKQVAGRLERGASARFLAQSPALY